MRYEWSLGSRNKIKPDIVGAELERIRGVDGELTCSGVVHHSQDDESPLHDAFEWDDAKAAGHHREEQARALILTIRVVVESDDTEEPPRRVYLNVENDGNYLTVSQVLSDDVLRQKALKKAFSALSALKRKYGEYEELFGVFQEAEKAAAKVA